MATPEVETTVAPPTTVPAGRTEPGPRPYRLSVRQYLEMIAAGIFPPEARVELRGGLLVEQMTKGTPHDYSLDALGAQLRPMLPAGQILREDKSLLLGPQSRPEPDLAIVAGPRSRYRNRDPAPQDVAFLVEVADPSYADDRGEKWRLYAAGGIPRYWILNIPKRQVEVYRDPADDGDSAAYRIAEVYGEDAVLPVIIAGFEVGRIAIRDILP